MLLIDLYNRGRNQKLQQICKNITVKQHSTALRQNNEQNRLHLRKLAIIVKPLTGLNQLGSIIFEAARVGTIMKVVEDDLMVL